ncbi:MAG: hypothetical protein ACJ8H8_13845 [Geminicoccaceae bacterium]
MTRQATGIGTGVKAIANTAATLVAGRRRGLTRSRGIPLGEHR